MDGILAMADSRWPIRDCGEGQRSTRPSGIGRPPPLIGGFSMKEHDDATPWGEGETAGSVLRATARRHPWHDAVVFPALGLRWSWSELDRRVDQVASGLLWAGVRPGEHVGIWSMNAPEWVVTQF